MSNNSFAWSGYHLHRTQFQAIGDRKISLSITRKFYHIDSFIFKKQVYTIVNEGDLLIIGSDSNPETWIKASKTSHSGRLAFYAPKLDNKLEIITSNDFFVIRDHFFWIDPYIIGYILNILSGK